MLFALLFPFFIRDSVCLTNKTMCVCVCALLPLQIRNLFFIALVVFGSFDLLLLLLSIFYTIFHFNEPLLDKKIHKRQFFSPHFISFSFLSIYACAKWRSRSDYFCSRHEFFSPKKKNNGEEKNCVHTDLVHVH